MSLGGFVKGIRDKMRNDAGINGDAQRIEQTSWMLFLKVYDTKEQDWMFEDPKYVSIIPEKCQWSNWAVDKKDGKAMTGDTLLDFVNNTLFPTLKALPVTADTPIKKSIVQAVFQDTNNYMKDGVLLRQVINIIDELDLADPEEGHTFNRIYEDFLKELQSAGSAGEFYTPRAVTEFMADHINPKIGERMADFACGTGGFLTSWLQKLEPQIKTNEDQEKFDTSIYGIEKKQFPYILCVTNMLLHGVETPRVYHDNSLLKDVLDYTDKDRFDVILMNPPYGGSEKAEVKNHFPADLASSETADLFMSVIMYRLKKEGRAAVIIPDGFLFGADNAKLAIKKKLLSEFNLHTVIRMPSSVFAPYTPITTNILFFENNGSTTETWFYRVDMPEGQKHFNKTNPIKRENFKEADEWWENRVEIKDELKEGQTKETWKSKKFTAEELSVDYNFDLCGYPVEEKVILSPEETMKQFVERRGQLNKLMDKKLDALRKLLEV